METTNMSNNKRDNHFLPLHMEPRLWEKLLFTGLAMAALLFFVYYLHVPNPNMVLIAGLVICSALFGYAGGVLASVIMFLYTLYFFSTDNSFLSFTDENMRKVYVSIFGILVDMFFVCELKRRELYAFREIQTLTEKLRVENRRLQESSLTDGLTGIRNRLALRQDYPTYRDMELTVMMMDVDDFKSINDRFGHDQGDDVLWRTGALLAERFGREHCYRYGGDEFLVIYPNTDEAAFLEKLRGVMESKPVFTANGERVTPGYSVGYVHGRIETDSDLRMMLRMADDRMYASKRSGKDRIIGGGMNLSSAEPTP